jgi:hypothetical protein
VHGEGGLVLSRVEETVPVALTGGVHGDRELRLRAHGAVGEDRDAATAVGDAAVDPRRLAAVPLHASVPGEVPLRDPRGPARRPPGGRWGRPAPPPGDRCGPRHGTAREGGAPPAAPPPRHPGAGPAGRPRPGRGRGWPVRLPRCAASPCPPRRRARRRRRALPRAARRSAAPRQQPVVGDGQAQLHGVAGDDELDLRGRHLRRVAAGGVARSSRRLRPAASSTPTKRAASSPRAGSTVRVPIWDTGTGFPPTRRSGTVPEG